MTFPKGIGFNLKKGEPIKMNYETEIALFHSNQTGHKIVFDKYWKIWYCRTEYESVLKCFFDIRRNLELRYGITFCLNFDHDKRTEIEHIYDFAIYNKIARMIHRYSYVAISDFQIDHDHLTYPKYTT